ncbi:hypothetical protein LTR97_003567 [Elasticomyces elasticus]|uniref:Uncharacterized protein n=1 Tax=Elasticomyces elasticus TaxID=574655 RepID=A0AAN7VTA5_9PEZI|nr:hypothetical protein LTR97_003567 [Elasticomyces elasticus]
MSNNGTKPQDVENSLRSHQLTHDDAYKRATKSRLTDFDSLKAVRNAAQELYNAGMTGVEGWRNERNEGNTIVDRLDHAVADTRAKLDEVEEKKDDLTQKNMQLKNPGYREAGRQPRGYGSGEIDMGMDDVPKATEQSHEKKSVEKEEGQDPAERGSKQ